MEFGKNCLFAAAFMFLLLSVLAGYGFGLPSTSLSPERTTLKSFSSTQSSSSSFSEIITFTTTSTITSSSSPTTATTPATTTTVQRFHKPEETTAAATTTTTTVTTVRVTADIKEHGVVGKSKDASSDDTTTIVIVCCCCVGGLILLAIVGAYCIYRCLKKRATKRTQSEPNARHPDGTSKPDVKAKNSHTPQPPVVAVNPWAPEHVPASTFAYKGPLVLQTRPPAEIPMAHELDNEQPPSIHESHHVQFDDTQNVAVEIGSEVEVLMDGEKELPKKARSSLPSPYAQPGGKVGAPVGGKAKKKLSEKQKDKAIRE